MVKKKQNKIFYTLYMYRAGPNQTLAHEQALADSRQ